MGDPERELIAGARRAMAEERRRLGEPPTPDELIAYAEGTLPAGERERIEAFAAADPEVARTLLDLAGFPEVGPVPAGAELTEEELEAGWRELRDGLREGGVLPRAAGGEEGRSAAPVPRVDAGAARPGAPVPRPGRGSRPWWRAPERLAALFAATTIGLGLYVAWLHLGGGGTGGSLGTGSTGFPRANPVVKSLLPVEESVERSAGEAEPVVLPPTSDSLVLLLGVLEAPATEGVRLEVYDAGGRRVWRADGLVRNPDGTFSVELPRGLLASGGYRLELTAPGSTRPFATYELELVVEPDLPLRR